MYTDEYDVTPEDRVVISCVGGVRTIRAYTRGTSEPIYVGTSIDAAADVLEVSRDTMDRALLSRPVTRDRDGRIIN